MWYGSASDVAPLRGSVDEAGAGVGEAAVWLNESLWFGVAAATQQYGGTPLDGSAGCRGGQLPPLVSRAYIGGVVTDLLIVRRATFSCAAGWAEEDRSLVIGVDCEVGHNRVHQWAEACACSFRSEAVGRSSTKKSVDTHWFLDQARATGSSLLSILKSHIRFGDSS